MNLPQIVLMAASTRPNALRYTYERLTDHAGTRRLYHENRIARPWLWYNKRRNEPIPSYFDQGLWDVSEHIKGRPFVLAFFRMFEHADPNADLIFIEDDLAPCANAVERVIETPIPDWAGVMTFFDYRQEWTKEGIFPHPNGRDLWGSQCLKFPARLIPDLKRIAASGEIKIKEGTDAWAGLATAKLGLTIAGYSPTIFQHTGMLSVYAPGRMPPVALNFPGESFNAMNAWDGRNATIWHQPKEDMYCPLHRKEHDVKDFGRCPNFRTG